MPCPIVLFCALLRSQPSSWRPHGHTRVSCTPSPPSPPLPFLRSLRSLTVIKGLEIPPKIRAYLDHFETAGDVPLYDVMAV